MPRGGDGPEFLRQRRRRLLVLDDGELRVTRRCRRGRTRSSTEEPEILARIPVGAGSLLADRNLITLRRLVLDDVEGPITFEFGMRARGFAGTLATAAA